MKKIKIVLINPEDISLHKRRSEINPFAGLAYIASCLDSQFGDAVAIDIIHQNLGIETY